MAEVSRKERKEVEALEQVLTTNLEEFLKLPKEAKEKLEFAGRLISFYQKNPGLYDKAA